MSRDGVVDKLLYGTCYKIENKILEGVYKALVCIQVTCRFTKIQNLIQVFGVDLLSFLTGY